jgi:glycosyltransferase involved in cell wall biosynthesis
LVPTRNEDENVALLVRQLSEALADLGRTWELLFLDDSDDATPDTIRDLKSSNPHISLLHREPGQRGGGLGSAVVAGIGAASGQVMVVMDGDLQHPPQMVRELSTAVLSGKYEIAIASRYVSGASNAGLDGVKRRIASRLSVALAHLLVPKTRGVRDPMSGFFAVSRESLAGTQLRPHGFKILMEVLARAGESRVAEMPFQMNARGEGDSKAGWREGTRFLRHTGRLIRARWTPSQLGRSVLLKLPLIGILAIQSFLSYKLIFRNSAFIDEATYLSAGNYELHVLLHGGPNMYFPTYFSGAPTIYPILGALANNVGGLHAARFLSLGFMLIATVLCYATARRLWGRPAGWLAAGVFVTTQGTQFLGAFATYDAMSLMLIALASWIVVRFASSVKSSSLIFLAVPVMVLANATKYASAIFDPIIIILAFFAILNYHGFRSALRTSLALLATFALMLGAVFATISNSYFTGIMATTISRAVSNASSELVLHDAWKWVGAIACIAFFTAVLSAGLAWKRKSSWATTGMVSILALAVLLVPANQARIHTTTSLFKHVTFGAWFGAVAAGWLLHNLSKLRWEKIWRNTAFVSAFVVITAALTPLLIVGTTQARQLYEVWPTSTKVVNALRPLVTNLNRPVLMDDAMIGMYYLQDELPLPYWYDSYYFSYVLPGTKTRILGLPAYRAAVRNGFFSVIALDWYEEPGTDDVISNALHASKLYTWVGDFSSNNGYVHHTYVIWRLKDARK